MANQKISQMTTAASLVGDELLPIVQNGSNKSTTVNQIRDGMATEEWVQNAIDNAGGKTVVVTSLPVKGDANKIYLVPNESARTNDVYDEYIYLTGNGWEFLGNKQVTIDLTGYYTKAEVDALIRALDTRLTALEGK